VSSPVSRNRVLCFIALAELLAKSLWFSGTAVIPQLSREWHADVSLTSWLTLPVQLGFVAGALILAASNLLDLVAAAWIFAASGVLGAIFIVSEVSGQRYVGTALTMQTAMGFLLTAVSIRAVAAIGTAYGWRWAALSMAIGPAMGVLAMVRLQHAPEPAGVSRAEIAIAGDPAV